jgi:hypothetical protein
MSKAILTPPSPGGNHPTRAILPWQPECIDLAEQFGRRYRVEYEESYFAQYGRRARVNDPWLKVLVCRHGEIYPFGGNTLAASVDGHPKLAGRLRRLGCCRVVQDGDLGELTATFDVVDFRKVAKVMRPRLRRELTAEQRAELIGRLDRHRSRSTPKGPTEGQFTAHTREVAVPDDPGALCRQMGLFDPSTSQV